MQRPLINVLANGRPASMGTVIYLFINFFCFFLNFLAFEFLIRSIFERKKKNKKKKKTV